MKPMYDRVIVKKDPEYISGEKVTSGGIFLPSDKNQKSIAGVVVSVGNGMLNKETGHLIPLLVKVGDKVVFSSYSAVEIDADEEGLVAVRESDIIAIK